MRDIPGGVATGIGSLPGHDVDEGVRTVFGELPQLPYLPELPQRGPGADLIGRTTGLLVDIPVELYAGQWQVAMRDGIDMRRTRDFLERDLDALTDICSEHDGPVKIAAAGPWTLAASLWRVTKGPMLTDMGAVAELTASLSEGLFRQVTEVAARLPHAQVILQIDEPLMPAVLKGEISTESGLSRYRAVEPETVRRHLGAVIDAVGCPVIVHCCADCVPVGLIAEAGAGGVALDLSLVDMDAAQYMDPLGEMLESGLSLVAGAVPTHGEQASDDRAAADLVRKLWERLGLSQDSLREQVVVSPACGLAGATNDEARSIMSACRQAARRLSE